MTTHIQYNSWPPCELSWSAVPATWYHAAVSDHVQSNLAFRCAVIFVFLFLVFVAMLNVEER